MKQIRDCRMTPNMKLAIASGRVDRNEEVVMVFRSGFDRSCVKRVCILCHNEMLVELSNLLRREQKYCSEKCRLEDSNFAVRGSAHPAYKFGQRESQRLIAQRYRANNPEKVACRVKTRKAIADGVLVRQICEVCGNPEVEPHHEDYSDPLKVKWLCKVHHVEHHNSQPRY